MDYTMNLSFGEQRPKGAVRLISQSGQENLKVI